MLTSRKELIEDIYSRLGDLNPMVYDHVDEKPPMPHIEFSGVNFELQTGGSKDKKRYLVAFQFTVVSDYQGKKEVTELSDQLIRQMGDNYTLQSSILDTQLHRGYKVNAEILTYTAVWE